MFIVVLGIVSCNYGPYVLWLPPGPSKLLSTISIGIFHVLVALLLSSYVMCVFTDPGTVPTAWHRMVESDEALAGQHRFCHRDASNPHARVVAAFRPYINLIAVGIDGLHWRQHGGGGFYGDSCDNLIAV